MADRVMIIIFLVKSGQITFTSANNSFFDCKNDVGYQFGVCHADDLPRREDTVFLEELA